MRKRTKRDKELRRDKDRIARGATSSGFPRKIREADELRHMDEREEGEIN